MPRKMLVAACFMLLGLAACCGPTPSPSAPVTLNVGLLPVVDVAPIYLGDQQGFFKEQKLTLNLKLAQGGAAIIPAAVWGAHHSR